MSYDTSEEGVIIVYEKGTSNIIGFVHKDLKTHKNIWYECKEMSFDSIKELLEADKVKI